MHFQLFLFFSRHNRTSSLYLIQQVQLQLIIFISCARKSTFEIGKIHCILIAERIEPLNFRFGVSFLAQLCKVVPLCIFKDSEQVVKAASF